MKRPRPPEAQLCSPVSGSPAGLPAAVPPHCTAPGLSGTFPTGPWRLCARSPWKSLGPALQGGLYVQVLGPGNTGRGVQGLVVSILGAVRGIPGQPH